MGFGDDAIDYRVKAGRLHLVYVGVYAVGHPRLTPRGQWMAAALACGPDAVLSHQDAAALWQILRRSSSPLIHVTTARSRKYARPGIKIHRPRQIHPDDCAVCDGIPTTSVARTLVDLAATCQKDVLTRAWDEAARLRLFTIDDIEAVRARSRGRRGLGAIDALIAEARPLPAYTRSDLEWMFLELCRKAGLPTPAANIWIDRFEVDFAWVEQRLVVELNSDRYHADRAARERDAERSAALQLLGYRVLPVTDRRLVRRPETVVADVRELLARR